MCKQGHDKSVDNLNNVEKYRRGTKKKDRNERLSRFSLFLSQQASRCPPAILMTKDCCSVCSKVLVGLEWRTPTVGTRRAYTSGINPTFHRDSLLSAPDASCIAIGSVYVPHLPKIIIIAAHEMRLQDGAARRKRQINVTLATVNSTINSPSCRGRKFLQDDSLKKRSVPGRTPTLPDFFRPLSVSEVEPSIHSVQCAPRSAIRHTRQYNSQTYRKTWCIVVKIFLSRRDPLLIFSLKKKLRSKKSILKLDPFICGYPVICICIW